MRTLPYRERRPPAGADGDSSRRENDTELADDGPGAPPGADGPPRSSAERALGTVVGRHVILNKLGAGGMGVVYAAYDPELDRRIALKLLRPGLRTDGDHRTRLLREAKALGRLAHPNVVGIHDVGTFEDQVWLAMELVQGRTLTAWLGAPHGWREVVTVMRSAGRGLAAAHAAGLLHRDFKPDNVMIGDDGRVRVMDFGLAQARPDAASVATVRTEPRSAAEALEMHLTRTGVTIGTPAYMAPEQFRNDELTAATDQFAFCVTLWQALYGQRPFAGRNLNELAGNVLRGQRSMPPRGRAVPARLRRACERGLSVDPRARWPSMRVLLAQLDAMIAPRRRLALNVAVAGGLVGGLSLAVIAYQAQQRRAERAELCSGAAAELAGMWDEPRRRQVESALLGTELRFAPDTWQRVETRLDRYTEAWTSKHTEVCEATSLRQEQSSPVMDLRMSCLRKGKLALDAVIETLAHADAETAAEAIDLVTALPEPSRCDDVERLEQERQRIPPPEDPEVARAVQAVREQLVQLRSARSPSRTAPGLAQLAPLMERAEALAYGPLLAEAKLERGTLLLLDGQYARAEQELADAYGLAVEHGHDEVAFQAARESTRMVGTTLERGTEGLAWAHHALLPLAKRSREPTKLATGLRVLGSVLDHHGKYEEAERELRRALELLEGAGGDHDLALASTLVDLGNLLGARGKLEEAAHHLERALAIHERELGPDHPYVAVSSYALGAVRQSQGKYEEAERLLRRALDIEEHALRADHPELANGHNLLGVVLAMQGNPSAAEEHFRRALELQERSFAEDHPDIAGSLNNLGSVSLDQGKSEAAERYFRRALYMFQRMSSGEDANVALALHNVGTALERRGKNAEAEPYLRRALEMKEHVLGADHPELAFTQNSLGVVLARLDREQEAEPFLRRALELRERALGPDHPLLAESLIALGRLLEARGELVQAEPPFRRALELEVRVLGSDSPELATPLLGLARVRLGQQDHETARRHAERALAVQQGASTPDPLMLAEARFVLARCLWPAARQRPRAHALMRQALQGYAQAGEPAAAELAAAREWLKQHRA